MSRGSDTQLLDPSPDRLVASRSPHASVARSTIAFLLGLAAIHFIVDTMAMLINPLWPELGTRLGVGEQGVFLIFMIWSLAVSFTQFLFGYLGDRFSGRLFIWLGPAAAIVCIGSVGWTRSPVLVTLLLVMGGLGVAAFHPEAAARAGHCMPHQRSRAMSLFVLGGFLGSAISPAYSGYLTQQFGMTSLSWTMIWALPGLGISIFVLNRIGRGPTSSAEPYAPLRQLWRGKAAPLTLVVCVQALRVAAAGGAPIAMAFLLKTRGANSQAIGLAQSVFLSGIGAGGLACAVIVRDRYERRMLWILPLVAVPLLLVIPLTYGFIFLAAVGLSALLLGMVIPVMISYGQRLVPEGERTVSSLTMGVSWGIGNVIVYLAMSIQGHFEQITLAFVILAGSTALSSVLSLWLPGLRNDE